MSWIDDFKKFKDEYLEELNQVSGGEGLLNGMKKEYAKTGFNPDDIIRERIIPFLSLLGVGCTGTNVLIQAARVNIYQDKPECISVDKPTVISNNDEDLLGRCTQDVEALEKLTADTIAIRYMISDSLVANCAFKGLIVDNNKGRVVATDSALPGLHYVQRPDNNWTVVADGYAELKQKESGFEAGSYTSFLQPYEEFSMACAQEISDQIKNVSFDNPAEFICSVHFDSITTFNGTGYGESIIPVVGCGNVKAPNPKNLEGSTANKESAHYNHIPIGNTY